MFTSNALNQAVANKIPRLPKKELEMIIELLKSSRRASTFQTASFTTMRDDQTNEEYTEEVRASTRLFRETWIGGPIDVLIHRYERALKEQYKSWTCTYCHNYSNRNGTLHHHPQCPDSK